MSTYVEISKMIGWEGRPIPIPSVEAAQTLYDEVMNDKSETAYMTVFRYNRYCRSAENEDQISAQNMIFKAFTEGRKFFE